MEEFLKSGAVPADARLTENGTILRLLQESTTFWDDLVDLGFDTESAPVEPRQPTDQTRPTPEPSGSGLQTTDKGLDVPTLRWDNVEIRFTSELRVQIFVFDKPGDALNFGDMGFEDRRRGGGKPIQAWNFLLELAKRKGICPAAKVSGDQQIQKRAQELRDLLQSHFHMTGDPLPFVEGTGYSCRFKIRLSPSFNT
jgi:hypothetical protein